MWRWVPVVVVGLLPVSGCSDADDDTAVASTTTASALPDDDRCSVKRGLDDVREAFSSPKVFELSEDDLEDLFSQRRALGGRFPP